ncbi:MAG: hypothetical protein ACT4OY_03175 [Alphaproteobacteria bacterium]
MNKIPGYRLFPALLMSILLLTQQGSALAKPPAPTVAASPCDTKYYESLKSRAWLEAQREITQNQNLIFKPDSVLQYTCFDQFIGVLGSKAGGMFSDSPPPPTGGPLGTVLINLVGTAVNKYLTANFSGPMLSGRSTITYSPTYSSSYNCTVMNRIWKEAKCMNFAAEPEEGFFTFAQYASSSDKRLPPGCANSTFWQEEIDNATGTQTEWIKDPTKTFFDELTICQADQAIATGIMKSTDATGGGDPEKFCIPPGCTYSGTTCKKL